MQGTRHGGMSGSQGRLVGQVFSSVKPTRCIDRSCCLRRRLQRIRVSQTGRCIFAGDERQTLLVLRLLSSHTRKRKEETVPVCCQTRTSLCRPKHDLTRKVRCRGRSRKIHKCQNISEQPRLLHERVFDCPGRKKDSLHVISVRAHGFHRLQTRGYL